MHGKIKSIYGIYKKHGREEFLEVAKCYSSHVKNSIDKTISEMESRFYDSSETLTEAEKMVLDYNNGDCVFKNQDNFSHANMEMTM